MFREPRITAGPYEGGSPSARSMIAYSTRRRVSVGERAASDPGEEKWERQDDMLSID